MHIELLLHQPHSMLAMHAPQVGRLSQLG